jgi:DNA-binding MarR family transcriptional regulator
MPKRLKDFPYASSAAAADQRTEFLLWRAHHLARQAFDVELRTLQIDTRHFEVLSALAACEALNRTQIANCLDLERSAIPGLVRHLERMGFIQRRPDPFDIRAIAVEITPQGRKCLKDAQKIAVQIGGKIFSGLSESEREQLDRNLLHIISNYQN